VPCLCHGFQALPTRLRPDLFVETALEADHLTLCCFSTVSRRLWSMFSKGAVYKAMSSMHWMKISGMSQARPARVPCAEPQGYCSRSLQLRFLLFVLLCFLCFVFLLCSCCLSSSKTFIYLGFWPWVNSPICLCFRGCRDRGSCHLLCSA
jgi:hypothetical protein